MSAWDGLGRKLSEAGPFGTPASEYDLAGRRTRLSWPGGFSVDYDHLVTGEVSAIREGGAMSGPGVRAVFAGTLGSGPTAATVRYDPAMRLLDVTENGNATRFLFDGGDLIAEYANSTLITRTIPGPGIGWKRIDRTAVPQSEMVRCGPSGPSA